MMKMRLGDESNKQNTAWSYQYAPEIAPEGMLSKEKTLLSIATAKTLACSGYYWPLNRHYLLSPT